MRLLPYLSLFFVALLTTTSLAAAEYVTPEKYQVNEYMTRYSLGDQNNSLQLACEIGQFVSEEYNWNCDIRQLNFSNHAPVYLNVFYPAAPNQKGYEAYYGWFGPQKKEVTAFTGKDKKMYYTDWHDPGQVCYISGVCSYGIVKSYFGNITTPKENIIENKSTQQVIIIVPNNTNGSAPPKPMHEAPVEVYNNTFENSGNNNTIQSMDLNGSEINNTVTNSTNTVQNQGIIDSVKQYWFDFKNANLSNVSFNFWGN